MDFRPNTGFQEAASEKVADVRSAAAPVRLHIDELVLYGFPSADRHRIADSVQREFTRLLRGQPLPSLQSNLDLEQLAGAPIVVQAGSRPELVGTQIAAALHRSLMRESQQASRAIRQTNPRTHASPTSPSGGNQ